MVRPKSPSSCTRGSPILARSLLCTARASPATATAILHPADREATEITAADGIATLGKAFLSAEAELLVAFLSFAVAAASARSAFSTGSILGRRRFHGDGFEDVGVLAAVA